MKSNRYFTIIAGFALAFILTTSCMDLLDEPAENIVFTEETDYTVSGNMILPLIGAYAEFQSRGWEDFPLISVRGDDVNAGGLGDQQDYAATDNYAYNKDYWMYNSLWQNLYNDIFVSFSAEEQIDLYKEHAPDKALADQYKAEAKVLRGFMLIQLTRVWGSVYVPTSSDPSELFVAELKNKDQVMQEISMLMDEAIPYLPSIHPNKRTDIPGGATKYTALAIKAIANLEQKSYQAVADATAQIISSGAFGLEPDFYELFKTKGKLNTENILEIQYSDFGQGTGTNIRHLFDFYGPQSWTPKVAGSNSGWGFYEPSLKYIKFMLDRGETVRLETSVLFTNRGIAEIQKDSKYATMPGWVSNTTRSGDVINDYARALFASGKHYMPSDQLIPGRTDYGSNKNFTCIRYAEILLMHAEALTQGASSTSMSADDAVNAVRARAGLGALSGVGINQVIDEKFAELAMEWGVRYYDMIRMERYNELSYDGRTFTAEKTYLPYPQNQIDLLPALAGN